MLVTIHRSSPFHNIQIIFHTFSQTFGMFENRIELLAILVQLMPLACQHILLVCLENLPIELVQNPIPKRLPFMKFRYCDPQKRQHNMRQVAFPRLVANVKKPRLRRDFIGNRVQVLWNFFCH